MHKKASQALSVLTLAVAATLAGGAHAATPAYTSITGTGGVTNAGLAGDGYFPPDGTYFQTDTAYWDNTGESITFAFDQAYQLSGLKITVDNNDFYRVYISTNGSTWETYATILAFEGTVNGGVETFTLSLPATANAYSFAKVEALFGDNAYSVGEVQFTGMAVTPVPEPATMAMLLAGLGVVGATVRRRSQQRG
jgi:hypothetical protein